MNCVFRYICLVAGVVLLFKGQNFIFVRWPVSCSLSSWDIIHHLYCISILTSTVV